MRVKHTWRKIQEDLLLERSYIYSGLYDYEIWVVEAIIDFCKMSLLSKSWKPVFNPFVLALGALTKFRILFSYSLSYLASI